MPPRRRSATPTSRRSSSRSLSKTDSSVWPTPASGDPVYILYLPAHDDAHPPGQERVRAGRRRLSRQHDGRQPQRRVRDRPALRRLLSSVTLSASHELAEAATDPYPRSRPAWSGFRDDDLAWEMFQQFQSENGDACEFYRDSELAPGRERRRTSPCSASGRTRARGRSRSRACPSPGRGVLQHHADRPEDIAVDLSALGGDAKGTDIRRPRASR